MALTTFEEEIYLRVLTGRLVAKALSDMDINKLAVVAPRNIICTAMAASTESSFITITGGVTYHFLVELGKNEEEVSKKLEEFDADMILIQFGGESPIEEVKESFKILLRNLSRLNVNSDIMIHVRTFASGALKEALEDKNIKEFLLERNLYVYTIDLDKGRMFINEYDPEENELYPILEYNLTLEHIDLLNRSLKDRKITFS